MSEKFIVKYALGNQLRFTEDGDLVEILMDTGNGNYARLQGAAFLHLTECVLEVAQDRVKLKEEKRAAELKKAEEEWAKLPKPKRPHVSGPTESLTERCVNCGYGETIVAKMVSHYSGLIPYSLQECPGSPEERAAATKAESEVRQQNLHKFVSDLDLLSKSLPE